jgi:peptide/nickel transport system substrate-binding protein
MQSRGYWSSALTQRLNRRRYLLASSGLALGATLLAACSGKSSGSKQETSSLVQVAKDTSNSAKRGGTHLLRRDQDVVTNDVHFLGGSSSIAPPWVFSRLIRQKPGYLQPAGVEFIGDMAESWEFNPDKTQLTVKLRPNMKWHTIPPVNGRQIDGDDVVASWKRFEATGTNRSFFSAKVNPDAPVDTVTAVDARTINLKLAAPLSVLIGLLATRDAGMYFMPKEADSGYDARRVAIGSGPWQVEEHVASARIAYKRHEGHPEAPRIYIDRITEFIIPEYAAMMAQFRTGAILELQGPASRPDLRQEDAIVTKKEVPALSLTTRDPPTNYGFFKYGWNPALGEKTPFRDKRLRQAFSLSTDRELMIETIHNIERLKAEGIPLEAYQHTAVQADSGGAYWLDPTGKDFGPNAKYFQQNIAEGKKLVAAAGFANGLEAVANYPGPPGYGDTFNRHVAIYLENARQIGLNLKSNTVGFTTEWRPKFFNVPGDYDGLAWSFRPAAGIFDPVEIAWQEFVPGSNAYCGLFSEGSSYMKGDPDVTALLKRARAEFDEKRRVSLMHDFQRLEASNQYRTSFAGTAQMLGLAWEAVENVNVFHGEHQNVGTWLNPAKKPLGSSN